MADAHRTTACCITPMLGLCIQTAALMLTIPIFIFKKEQLEQLRDIQNFQDPSELKNPASALETCISCLFTIGMVVNNSLLLDQVLNISSECQALIEGHRLFWHAAQIQAYVFLTGICLVGFFCCCGCCLMYAAKKSILRNDL